MIDLLENLHVRFLSAALSFISEYRSNAAFRMPIDTLYSVFLILGRWRQSQTWKPFGKDVIKIICQYALFNNTIPNKET